MTYVIPPPKKRNSTFTLVFRPTTMSWFQVSELWDGGFAIWFRSGNPIRSAIVGSVSKKEQERLDTAVPPQKDLFEGSCDS